MLFVISTPIGNLQDFSPRAISTLDACDLILCEDTRTSLPLLSHFGIQKTLVSYHKFNEAKSEEKILSLLREGKKIALISDAGTPGVSDPGQSLVALCHQEQLPVTVIPGPSAPIAALSLSGFRSDRFQFLGFLPKTESELLRSLQEAVAFSGTTLFFTTPHRVHKDLALFAQKAPNQKAALVRELTKKFEECLVGSFATLANLAEERTLKGEFVLLIESEGPEKPLQDLQTLAQEVLNLQEEMQVSKSEAIKLISQKYGISKNKLYEAVFKG